MKNLEQLKAENAGEEVSIDENLPKAEEVETKEEAVEEVAEEDGDPGEGGDSEASETETEAWMQTEEQTSEDSEQDTVPLSALTSMRGKLKGKIGEQNSELEQLRAEVDLLKRSPQAPAQETATPAAMPTLEDSDYDEAKHQQAVTNWMADQVQTQVAKATQTSTQTAGQAEALKQLDQAVDGHYQRAEKLAKESGITAEIYQSSDTTVRQLFETARPGMGDKVADYFISQIGEGSEKVMFFVGRNKAAQEKLKASLATDPSGISTALLLGEMKNSVAAPQKKTSRAPKPASKIQGDESSSVTNTAKRLKKAYQAAHKNSGGGQAAYNAKKEAKAAGVDTSDW